MSISFNDFMKISLKVGKIKKVELHPDADKLYVLKVDLGAEEIQLVAGLRPSYTEKELLEQSIVVLNNLESKSVRGVESQGMLLAADDNGKPIIIQPEKEAPVGTNIR